MPDKPQRAFGAVKIPADLLRQGFLLGKRHSGRIKPDDLHGHSAAVKLFPEWLMRCDSTVTTGSSLLSTVGRTPMLMTASLLTPSNSVIAAYTPKGAGSSLLAGCLPWDSPAYARYASWAARSRVKKRGGEHFVRAGDVSPQDGLPDPGAGNRLVLKDHRFEYADGKPRRPPSFIRNSAFPARPLPKQ